MVKLNQGIVKWYNKHKGYGFIGWEKEDLFVHRSEIEGKKLMEGDKVEFEVGIGEKGSYAKNIRRVKLS